MAESRTSWQRARRPEEKEERRTSILQAAAKLLDNEGMEGTGLNAIAREAGISKPNLYRYFESREAILLELLLEEHRSWAKSFRQKLARVNGTGDPQKIADAFAGSIAGRKRYCVLIGALATVLERNVGAETVREFKRELQGENLHLTSTLQEKLPTLKEEEAYRVLAMMLMAASGMWPHSHPSPVVQEVLKEPEFAGMKFNFKDTVREHTCLLLRGILA